MPDDLYLLYGAGTSLYTGKVRAYFRYKDIPFREEVATFINYLTVIIPRSRTHFIPIIISPDDIAVQDTTDIIDFLEERFPQPPIYPHTPRQRLVSLLFEVFGDEWLFLPAMHYRWSYKKENLGFILKEFGAVGFPWLPAPLHKMAGVIPAILFGGLLTRLLGVTRKTGPQIEKRYEQFLDHFNEHLEQHPFILGTRPSIGDFGLMAPLYAHLYRDPYPGRMMKSRAPGVADWVERMNAPDVKAGEFLQGDEVPDTLYPIIKLMAEDHFPVLEDIIDKVDKWIEDHPGRKVPRFVGFQEFQIGGVKETRAAGTISQWMFQRPLFYYQALSPDDRASVDELLRKVGMYQLMQKKIKRPIKRLNNIMVPE